VTCHVTTSHVVTVGCDVTPLPVGVTVSRLVRAGSCWVGGIESLGPQPPRTPDYPTRLVSGSGTFGLSLSPRLAWYESARSHKTAGSGPTKQAETLRSALGRALAARQGALRPGTLPRLLPG